VCAQVKNCTFVDLGCFILRGVDLRVILNELADLLDKAAVLLLHFEVLFLGKVGQANQQMHQNGNLQIGHLKQTKHGLHQLNRKKDTCCACLGSADKAVRVEGA